MENREVRLIDANVFIKDLTAMKSAYDAIALDGMVKALKEAPTIDPESLRPHGKWIMREDYNFDTYYDCSVCDESFCFIEGVPEENFYRYCPNCGAKMDGEVE